MIPHFLLASCWAALTAFSAAVPLAIPTHNTTFPSLDVDTRNWGHAVPTVIKNTTAGSNTPQIIIPPGSAVVKSTGDIVTGACSFTDKGVKCYSAVEYAAKLDAEAAQTARTFALHNVTIPKPNLTNPRIRPAFYPVGVNQLRNPWRSPHDRDGPEQDVTMEMDCRQYVRVACTLAVQYTKTYTATVTVGANWGRSASDIWSLTGFGGTLSGSVASAHAQTMTYDIRGTRGKLIWRPKVFDYGGDLWVRTCHGSMCDPPVSFGPVVAEAPVPGHYGTIFGKIHSDRWLRDPGWYHLDSRDVPWRFDSGDVDNVFTPSHCAQMAAERDKNLAIWRSNYNKCWFKDVHWEGARTFDTWGGFIGRYDIPGYDRWMPGSPHEWERQQWINDRACDVVANGNDGRFYCKRFEECGDCVMMLRRN